MVPLVYDGTASSTWAMPHAGVASGTAIVSEAIETVTPYSYQPELPHSPEIGPVDAFTGAALAVTTVAVVAYDHRPTFRFWRSLDDPA